jgi:hypothetical protein
VDQRVDAASFAEIEAEFIERVHRVVWCNVATIDRRGRPRSRILHPIWEGATGWIATRRPTLKARHLANNPYVSLAYVADVAKPVYVDCRATWEDTLAEKQRVWALLLAAPPPLGYDPAPIFGSPERDDFGLLKLTPWRIELADFPAARRVWHAPAGD